MTTFALPDLPYDYAALEPTVSETTMRTHHDKHHAAYINNVNTFLKDAGRGADDMESLVKSSQGSDEKMFNNAGQAWNHGFFWNVMSPKGGEPTGKLAQAIEAFGGLAQLRSKFVAAGAGQFGSGWAWVQARPDGGLEVFSTANGDTALLREGVPVLGVDVWEHAYYLDYKQDRKAYLEGWFDKIVNWEFAGRQFDAATGSGDAYRFPAPQG